MTSEVISRTVPVALSRFRRVLVIGGGASGVLAAAHLLSHRSGRLRVTLAEREGLLGAGVAYATDDPDHLLNTRVQNMSAFPEDPEHFRRWLSATPDGAGTTGACFVSRGLYGGYLRDLLEPWLGDPARVLDIASSECLRIEEAERGIIAHFSDGSARLADLVILATGHVRQNPALSGVLLDPWEPSRVAQDQRVVIVGSGLTMVDKVLSLINAGHRGEILVMSRRGLLPRGHAVTEAVKLTLADVPLGAPLSVLSAWMRRLAREAEARGGTWRDAVDGIRPHLRAIWRGLAPVERARFLRHGAAFWDVHRHRVPPASERRLAAATAQGQLRFVRGEYAGATRNEDRSITVRIRPRGKSRLIHLECACVFDCRGIRRDPEENATPLIADLLSSGTARVDPLRLGLDVSTDCRLIDRRGVASERIFVVGPASRAAFWEITAIPDIRDQIANLARLLATEGQEPVMVKMTPLRR